MKLILTNGRTFIIKVKYTEIEKESAYKDKYNRLVQTFWTEHATNVTIEEVTEKLTSSLVFKGYAYCSYKDTYSKKVGKELAYYNAVSAMVKANVIDSDELCEIDSFKLNKWVQDNRKGAKSC